MKVYLASLWLQFIHLSYCSELSSDLAHLFGRLPCTSLYLQLYLDMLNA
ncbi:hypothetical protein Hanom_Chr06g00505431 [Helianthus anomalus]